MYAVYATLMIGSVIAIGVLADSSRSGLIVYVLAFMALISVGLLIAVPLINSKNPGNLLLGEVSAREYVALKLGDDVSGETIERLLGPPTVEGIPPRPPQAQLTPPPDADAPSGSTTDETT